MARPPQGKAKSTPTKTPVRAPALASRKQPGDSSMYFVESKAEGKTVAWAAIGLTLILNTLTVGYTYGVLSTRVSVSEQQLSEVRGSLREITQLTRDVDIVKTRVDTIIPSIQRLERAVLERGRHSGYDDALPPLTRSPQSRSTQ